MSGANLYYPWADIAADAGLVVRVTDTNAGWERRARSSGGFPAAPLGVMWHHAASSPSTSDEACVNYQVRGNPDNPVGNMTLGRDGAVWPVAGGASNCSGKGGPMSFSRGTCAKDSGNTETQAEMNFAIQAAPTPVSATGFAFRAFNTNTGTAQVNTIVGVSWLAFGTRP